MVQHFARQAKSRISINSNSDVQPLVTESQTKAIKEDQNETMKENKENNNKETEPDAKQEQKQLEDKDDFDG